MSDPKLHDEAGRVAALKRYEILDTPPEAPFERITGLVKAVLDVPMATISMVDTDRQWFKSRIGLEASETARDISFCTHTIQKREPLIVADASLDPRFAQNPLFTGPPCIMSYIGVPLATPDGYNLGALCALDTRPRTFSAAQVEVLKSFAAIAMDEIELRRLAQFDQLTGAVTRRWFRMEQEKAVARFIRDQRPSTLILMDIDHFKRVNDSHGHPAGDLVLHAVAKSVAAQIRTNDVLGRIGGEEFGILLAETELEAAAQAAERFRQTLEDMLVPHHPPLRVTASFGIAALAADCLSAELWTKRADQRLYAAKRAGRNRCCAADLAEDLSPPEPAPA